MWAEFGRKFEQSLSPRARGALRQLRENGSDEHAIPAFDDAKVWRRGFTQMFGALGTDWEERMAIVIARAVSSGRPVVLLTRKIAGRNLRVHAAAGTTLDEITRWVLYVQPKRIGAKPVPCLHHRRNVQHRWTTRLDWRLPAEKDGARYPFCPPLRWSIPTTEVWRAIEGKPAWADAHGNGWARPNIEGGQGNHWDVFVEVPTLAERIGLNQINVVEFGSPEGRVGHIHHVPKNKKPYFKDKGWTCP